MHRKLTAVELASVIDRIEVINFWVRLAMVFVVIQLAVLPLAFAIIYGRVRCVIVRIYDHNRSVLTSVQTVSKIAPIWAFVQLLRCDLPLMVGGFTFIIIVELLKNSSLCLGLAFRCETYLYIFCFVTFFVDLLLPVLSQSIQSLQL